ncbi:putative protein-lysine deacylase ABHD14B [Tachypleus tridentatus]|uniref:putative protein-lysine deacylase ABHD14B n=1 Tax=Tachypleus tridentatus TaxID=6853 RepID=UPI003FD125E1
MFLLSERRCCCLKWKIYGKWNVDAVAANGIFVNVKIFYREALPKDTSNFHISILLLHRAAFSSKTWLDLGTIQMLAAIGYRTVTMDVPRFGNSERARISDRGEFINDVVKTLNLIRPVVVSRSMSGAFALPYLVKHSTNMGGYVPVGPEATSILERQPCGNGQSKEMSLDSVCESLKDYFSLPPHDLSCLKVLSLKADTMNKIMLYLLSVRILSNIIG